VELPLFPLNTVLFPGATMPLHIFEERYKEMIGFCLAEKSPFGVVLIREGQEVGGSAKPYDVGTTAYVTSVHKLEDGRMNLICTGGQRFRIVSTSSERPYMVGQVDVLETVEELEEETERYAETASALFAEYVRLYLAISNQWAASVEMPSAPDRLADYIASRLAVDHETKQALLEELSAHNRLAKEIEPLGELIQAMQPRLEAARTARWAGFSSMN
jgi:Lon protease-like protein